MSSVKSQLRLPLIALILALNGCATTTPPSTSPISPVPPHLLTPPPELERAQSSTPAEIGAVHARNMGTVAAIRQQLIELIQAVKARQALAHE